MSFWCSQMAMLTRADVSSSTVVLDTLTPPFRASALAASFSSAASPSDPLLSSGGTQCRTLAGKHSTISRACRAVNHLSRSHAHA
jgi:hypothetical protein